jgi:hypothetical protein
MQFIDYQYRISLRKKVFSYEEDVLNGVHPFIINDTKGLVMGNELRNSYITSSVEENKGELYGMFESVDESFIPGRTKCVVSMINCVYD